MELKPKGKRGGARKGAGAKPKYAEPTIVVSFCCPITKRAEFEKKVRKILSEWRLKQN